MLKQINIAICDDDRTQIEIIKSYINQMNKAYRFKIVEDCNGKRLLEKIKDCKIQIAFLDVQMDEIDGIKLGESIKFLYPNAILVYITGFKDYAFNAFKVKAFDYMLKPMTIGKFNGLMDDLLLRLEQIESFESKIQTVTIKNNDVLLQLKYEEIYYFEKYLRQILIYTTKGKYEFYGSLKQLLAMLDMNYFVQTHQSFIINKQQIFEVSKNNIYIRDINVHIPISRKHKAAVIEALEENIFA